MATKVSTPVVGSWFPSGYYGHYRSKGRTDFVNEYRQLSKPQPPKKFIFRSSQPSATHQFSTHDNRNSFMNDASYFAQGLGKKRHPERSSTFDPNFMAWSAARKNIHSGRPLTSTYRRDFNSQDGYVQKIVKRPVTSFDGVATSTYRTVHGMDSPNRDLINAMNNEALMLSAQSRQRQAKQKKSRSRETVASCMSWYRPRVVPNATATTNYEDRDHLDLRPTNAVDFSNLNNCASSGPSEVPVAPVPSSTSQIVVSAPEPVCSAPAPVMAVAE